MPNFTTLYNQMLAEEQRRESVYHTWYIGNEIRLTGGAKEKVKDFFQDIGLRIETDFEDQLVDWFSEYIGAILNVFTAVLTGGTSLPITTLLTNIGLDDELSVFLDERLAGKLKENIQKIQARINPKFNNLVWRERLWAFDSMVRGYMYRDIFIDGDYKELKDGVKKHKRVAARIMFYKTILMQMDYDWQNGYDVPSVSFRFDQSPKEIADKYALYLRRYKGEKGDKHVTITQADYTRVYKVHEFLQNEANIIKHNKKDQKLDNASKVFTVGGAILAAIFSFGS